MKSFIKGPGEGVLWVVIILLSVLALFHLGTIAGKTVALLDVVPRCAAELQQLGVKNEKELEERCGRIILGEKAKAKK